MNLTLAYRGFQLQAINKKTRNTQAFDAFWVLLGSNDIETTPGSFRRLYVSLDGLDRPSSSVQLKRSKAAQKPFRNGATKSSFFSVFRKCRAAFVH